MFIVLDKFVPCKEWIAGFSHIHRNVLLFGKVVAKSVLWIRVALNEIKMTIAMWKH